MFYTPWWHDPARLSMYSSFLLRVRGGHWAQGRKRTVQVASPSHSNTLTLCVFSWVWHKCPACYLHPPCRPKSEKLILTVPSFLRTLPSFCLSPSAYSSVVLRSSQTSASRCFTVWASVPRAAPTLHPRCTLRHKDSAEHQEKKQCRGRRRRIWGQQLQTWKNNSCDSRIVISTFVSCWVQQQVRSRHGNHRTNAPLHLPLKDLQHQWFVWLHHRIIVDRLNTRHLLFIVLIVNRTALCYRLLHNIRNHNLPFCW